MQKNTKGISSASYWYITLIVVVLAGLAATVYIIVTTSGSIKASLVQRSESMAELIPADSLKGFRGSEADLNNSNYKHLKKSFMAIRESNNDIRFIYILALRNSGKEAFFYIDSE